MTASIHTLAAPALAASKKRSTWIGLIVLLALSLLAAFPSHAIGDITAVGGDLGGAISKLSGLGNGIKAIVGFVGFVVALISLSALKNMGPVLFYIGLSIFASVGLVVAGSVMGAVI